MSTAETARAQRTAWADVARGIGIILVVYGHALPGVFTAETMVAAPAARLQGQIIYAFHMPLFFLLAGLWTEAGLRRGPSGYVRDKLWSVALPYLIWSLIEGVLVIAAGGAANSHLGMTDLAQIGWRPLHHFWFLYALLLCQLAAVLFLPRLWPLALLFGIGILGPFWGWDVWGRALVHLGFFTLGILATRAGVMRLILNRGAAAAGAVLCWIAFAVLFLFLYRTDGMIPPSPLDRAEIVALAVPGIAGTILMSMLLARVRFLAVLGQASMVIYVMHTIVSAGMRTVLRRLAGIDAEMLVLICTLAGLAVPFAIYLVLNRMNCLWLLGIEKPPPPGRMARAP